MPAGCAGILPAPTLLATKNSESGEKSRVLGFAAVMSPECLSSCVPSSRLLLADFAVARFWNWRISLSLLEIPFGAAISAAAELLSNWCAEVNRAAI
jgi:hypothetical protein